MPVIILHRVTLQKLNTTPTCSRFPQPAQLTLVKYHFLFIMNIDCIANFAPNQVVLYNDTQHNYVYSSTDK